MAIYPCDWTAHRYPGMQRSVYLTTAHGNSASTVKLRLCERHFLEELEQVRDIMAEVDEESQMSIICELCDEDRQLSMFAKVFDQHAEPVTFVVDLCATCAADVGQRLRKSHGRPVGEA